MISVPAEMLRENPPDLIAQVAAEVSGERPRCDCMPVRAWPDGPVTGYSVLCDEHRRTRQHVTEPPGACWCHPFQLGELWLHQDRRVPRGWIMRADELDWVRPGPSPLDVERDRALPPALCSRRPTAAPLVDYAPGVSPHGEQVPVRHWDSAVEWREIWPDLDALITDRLVAAMKQWDVTW